MIFDFEVEAYSYKLGWDTVVTKFDNGTEQRSCEEQIPRMDIEAEFILDIDDLREVRAQVFKDPTAVHQMVLWHEETHIVGTTGSGTIKVKVNNTSCILTGTQLIIRLEGMNDLLVTVDTIGLDAFDEYEVVTLPPVPDEYIEGEAQVLPLMDVYLRDNTITNRWRLNEIGRWSASFVGKTVYEGMSAGSAEIPTFGQYLVLDIPSSIGLKETLAEQHQGGISNLDDVGSVVPYSLRDNGDIARQAKFAWHTDPDRQYWHNFLFTLQGRRRSFLTPTWRRDLNLASEPTVASGTELDVTDSPDFRDWWQAQSHLRLALMFADGTFESVRVIDIDDNLDGTLTLTLADAMTSGDEIVFISFLEIVRLADDTVEFIYEQGKAHFDLPLVVIQDTEPTT